MERRPTIHLVYPHGPSIAAPDAIGRELGRRLAVSFGVVYHEWDGYERIVPDLGDVLVGHPHPYPGTTFRRSMRQAGWRRVVALSPFNLDPAQVAFLDRVLPHVDAYMAVTGGYWFERLGASAFSHWAPRMTHLDLAIDRSSYPSVKQSFNPAGARRFLYIGHSGWQKNTGYLSQIASSLPGVDFAWAGPGEPIEGLTPLGTLDFSDPEARRRIAGFDFMITVGRFDANPATILEAMSWGLVPVCTPQSGYEGLPGVFNVPLDDADAAAHILGDLGHADTTLLEAAQAANSKLLDEHFTWDRFAAQVVAAIESQDRPALGAEPLSRRAGLRCAELRSPYSPLRARALRSWLRHARGSR